MEGRDRGQDKRWIARFIKGQECRQRVLNKYLDGRTDRVQYKGDEAVCKQCGGVSSRYAEGIKVDKDRIYIINIVKARRRGDVIDEVEVYSNGFNQEEGSKQI